MKSQQGASLLEILIALSILGVVVLGFLQLQYLTNDHSIEG